MNQQAENNLVSSLLKPEERAIIDLRAIYRKYGYSQYKMSKFEEYDLYVRNKDFLVSDGIITFTDTNGHLMALKPDVTLSIVKNTEDLPGELRKVYYDENVYRISGSDRRFREITQAGLECIGEIGIYEICEVIMLAAESLNAVSADYILDVSHLGIIQSVIDEMGFDDTLRDEIVRCISEKNTDGIDKLCEGDACEKIKSLVTAYGSPEKVLGALRGICENTPAEKAFHELESIAAILRENGYLDRVRFDFSIVNDMNYYNGIVFQGYINGIPTGVLSGGQYDRLMQKMGRTSGAIGFALYLDLLERLSNDGREYDVDTVLLYDDSADLSKLAASVRELADSGASVLARKTVPQNLRWRTLARFTDGRIESIENDD